METRHFPNSVGEPACGARRPANPLEMDDCFPNCPDCADHVPPMPRQPYQRLIHRLDPTVNACGVEYHMRLQYGTLDHLPRETFRQEIDLAKACEAAEPGHLRLCAESYGATDEYERCEEFVSVIVRPEPPTIIVTGG